MPEVSLAELLLHVHFVQGSFYVVLSGSEVALIIDQGTCIPCPLFMLCSVLLFKRSTKKNIMLYMVLGGSGSLFC